MKKAQSISVLMGSILALAAVSFVVLSVGPKTTHPQKLDQFPGAGHGNEDDEQDML